MGAELLEKIGGQVPAVGGFEDHLGLGPSRRDGPGEFVRTQANGDTFRVEALRERSRLTSAAVGSTRDSSGQRDPRSDRGPLGSEIGSHGGAGHLLRPHRRRPAAAPGDPTAFG